MSQEVEHGHARAAEHGHTHGTEHAHVHGAEHGHSHGLVARSIMRSRAGLRAVSQAVNRLRHPQALAHLGALAAVGVVGAVAVALGLRLADPIIGLVISIVILRITWQSLRTVQADPGLGEPTGPAARGDRPGTAP